MTGLWQDSNYKGSENLKEEIRLDLKGNKKPFGGLSGE